MAHICPGCGNENPVGFRFCGFCGESLDVIENYQSEEFDLIQDRSARRSVTTLFVDLTNFTSAAESIDPEKIYRIIRNTLEGLAKIVRKYGGRVDRYYGDGFLATFGIPEAHEDDSYRALASALEMQEFMEGLLPEVVEEFNWDMKLRIGANVGRVVSGQLDTGSIFDTSIFGHTVNLAQRLQSAARPGTILVDQDMYRQTQGSFEYKPPVELQLKGIDNRVVAYEVIGERQCQASSRPLRSEGATDRQGERV